MDQRYWHDKNGMLLPWAQNIIERVVAAQPPVARGDIPLGRYFLDVDWQAAHAAWHKEVVRMKAGYYSTFADDAGEDAPDGGDGDPQP
jgi:hypothetical protein